MCTFKNALTILLVLFTSSIMVNGQQWSAISSEGNFWSLNTGNVGIGTVSPREKIDILGNGIITGKLGIGVSTNPVKKLEIWDGNAGRFTFSAASCTSGYEIAQTIDDTGYKLNVGSSIRNYKISLNGADKLKLLVNENIAFGTSSLNGITTGSDNTALGQYSLYSNTTGYHNIAIGPSAMKLNQTGAQNVAIGVYSLSNCTASDGNTAIGANSLRYTTTGVHNSALGKASLFNNTTGNYNMAIGSLALYNNTTGSNNHSMGFGALTNNTTGFNNIGIGYYAGAYIANGSSNNATSNNSLFIGSNTKAQADGQTNQIVIGNDVIGNGSNSVTLGNNSITRTLLNGNVGIGTTDPQGILHVRGTSDNAWIYFASNGGYTKPKPKIGYGLAFTWNLSGDNGESIINYSTQAGTSPRLDFTSFDGTNLTTEMTLKYGKLGIGTTTPSEKLTVAGGHGDTKIRLYSTGNGSDIPSNLSLWASEPNWTYYGTGIGYNVNGSPYYGRIDNTRGSSYVRFLPGETKFQFQNTSGINVDAMTILESGKVGIGISNITTEALLTVNGIIHAREIKVSLEGLADYVFNSDYSLMPLPEVEKFVKENKHLPEIPSANEVQKNGLSVGEMQNKLLQKIEELTLYVIELQKTNEKQSAEIEELKRK